MKKYVIVCTMHQSDRVYISCKDKDQALNRIKGLLDATVQTVDDKKVRIIPFVDEDGRESGFLHAGYIMSAFFTEYDESDCPEKNLKRMADIVEKESNKGEDWRQE